MKIQTKVNAGGVAFNHNESIRVSTKVKAGGLAFNHNQASAR